MAADVPEPETLLAGGPAGGAPASERLRSEEFPLDARAAELAPGPEEGHGPVLSAFATQQALVKTVRNDDWAPLIRKLQGPSFRTSLTLPPRCGRGMRFFRQVASSSVGLVWDRSELDLSGAHIWPSGYFAKSEFNVAADGSLLNGREDALVTLEDLMRANDTLTYEKAGTGETLPFNEILGPVEGTTGLVAIFARSTRIVHLLFAMGIRALLLRTLPGLGMLPILVHDPERGVRPFGHRAQSRLVSEYLAQPQLSPRRAMEVYSLPCLPVDSQFLELSELEQLVFQGVYGVTEEALAALVSTLLQEGRYDATTTDGRTTVKPCPLQTRALLALGLGTAVEADNANSALALVRHVAPLLVTTDAGCAEGPLALTLDRCRQAPCVPVSKEGEDFSGYLHKLAGQARGPNVLVPVGAAIALEEFAAGHMTHRIKAACQKLEAWLHGSTSFVFRLRSWHELLASRAPSGGPDIKSFVTHRAIVNRTRFYNALLELREIEEDHDVLRCMARLAALVDELHHPCMRLQLLREILGLDERYDLQTVARVASLARQVVSDALHFGGAAPAKQLSLQNEHLAPVFQLTAVAASMQGLDREEPPPAPAARGRRPAADDDRRPPPARARGRSAEEPRQERSGSSGAPGSPCYPRRSSLPAAGGAVARTGPHRLSFGMLGLLCGGG